MSYTKSSVKSVTVHRCEALGQRRYRDLKYMYQAKRLLDMREKCAIIVLVRYR